MFLRQITLDNLLSYGAGSPTLDLGPLNVLIGPNGSGKSNLIEAVSLLQAVPRDISDPVRLGGGVRDWICRGNPQGKARIEVVVDNPNGAMPLRHVLEFHESGSRFELVDERIENEKSQSGEPTPYFYYRYQHGRPAVNDRGGQRTLFGERSLQLEDVQPDQSILAQRKDPEQYPEITYLGRKYGMIRIYRDWTFGRLAPARRAQDADLDNRHLAENFLNLGMVINRIQTQPPLKQRFLDTLNDLYPGIRDFNTSVNAGKVQVFFVEGDYTIPATRLSDGTLRWLCLLAVLLDPDPPPLVCIEEPELGLHPDMLPRVAAMLQDASQRMQLVVTTHSENIIDALTDSPEAVIVCEKEHGQTSLRRLSSEGLGDWLEKYTLGRLWTQGELGGNRW
jgi:predicted ATPase